MVLLLQEVLSTDGVISACDKSDFRRGYLKIYIIDFKFLIRSAKLLIFIYLFQIQMIDVGF